MEKTLSQDETKIGGNGTVDGEKDRLTQLGRALSHTQRLAGIGSLSASTVLELTNPLNIITSSCSNLVYELQDKPLDQDLLKYYVGLIERSAFRIAQIIKVLQDYASLDEPQMVVTGVNMILRDARALVENQFLNQANIHITAELSDDLGSIVCDHNRITQVLVNLLANAREAMDPDGGTIQLRFWSALNRSITKKAAGAGYNDISRHLAFSVTDSGHGIPADIQDEIFKPFFSTRSNGQGVGLGLFVAKGIVEQHNGRIWAENNPSPLKGATFTVFLPLGQSF